MKIEIWSEGFHSSDGSSGAIKLFETEAKDFDEAVSKFNSAQKEGELKINRVTENGFSSLEAFNKRNHNYRFWGCALYDNELEARKSFG